MINTKDDNSNKFTPLDEYEVDLELAMNAVASIDELPSVESETNKIAKYASIAKNSLAKKKNVNLRLSARDLFKLKSKAIEEGVPYQTLMSSILHKFVNGKLTSV